MAGGGVDQLRGDADALAQAANAAFDDILHAELAAHALHVDILAAIAERGVARQHMQVPEARQLGDDVFGDAVAEILLLDIAAHAGEGQDGDGWLVARRGGGRDRQAREAR